MRTIYCPLLAAADAADAYVEAVLARRHLSRQFNQIQSLQGTAILAQTLERIQGSVRDSLKALAAAYADLLDADRADEAFWLIEGAAERLEEGKENPRGEE